ncbi:DNA-directed RNA polymerase III subunit [Phytophthora cinnamomi]|uniref:DNA-directed RNA polymerase III subunit n=1 Tax=Phytophthora cinnamomi TaxID=4785 RepID=UPI003559AE18|nr:DNA-directed RNA polymerase III subunit [Phytophthora cinnamomi]
MEMRARRHRDASPGPAPPGQSEQRATCEHAIVLNKASLDRGFGRCVVFKKDQIMAEKYANDRIVRPPDVDSLGASGGADMGFWKDK